MAALKQSKVKLLQLQHRNEINKSRKCEGFSMRTLVINENQKVYLRNKAYIQQIGELFQK